jgi:hypothetical protein
MQNEDEVLAQVRRVSSSQIPEQTFVIKKVGGRDITLKFVNNCFRRHFALPSKKAIATPSVIKMEHKADMRFMASKGGSKCGVPALKAKMQNPGFKYSGLSLAGAKEKILEKYSSTSAKLTVIDLSSGVDARMTEMALALVTASTGPEWKVGTIGSVKFQFTKDCVVHIVCSRNAVDATRIDHANSCGNTVVIEVVREAPDVFVFDHIKS